jgi:5'-nucleotidase
LAVGALLKSPVDRVVAGINQGANTGVDVFYSGTVAAAREATMIGLPAIAFSYAVRKGIDLDWNAATNLMSHLARRLWQEPLHGAGFWSVNFPSPIPPDALERVRRVPLAPTPVPPVFHRRDMDDDRFWEFTYEEAYWNREAPAESDYAAVCRGDVAVTAVPLFGAGAAGRRRGSERVVINHARRAEPLGKWRPRSE